MTGQSAAVVLRQLAAGLEEALPQRAEYAAGGNCLILTAGPGDGEHGLQLKAPDPLVAAAAGSAILLSFEAAGNRPPAGQSGISLLGFLDGRGRARFRGLTSGTVTGIQVAAQIRNGTIELPSLGKHAPSAATVEAQERRRQSIVLPVPELTLTAYETPDGRLCIAGEGTEEPAADTALLITTAIGGGRPAEWALFLRWSPLMTAVHTVLAIGRAGQGLVWTVNPEPVLLSDVPPDVLRRSQAAADEHSGSRIADFLADYR